MSHRNEQITIEAEVEFKSDKAYKVFHRASGQTVWLPASNVEYDGMTTFLVPRWLAEEKGID